MTNDRNLKTEDKEKNRVVLFTPCRETGVLFGARKGPDFPSGKFSPGRSHEPSNFLKEISVNCRDGEYVKWFSVVSGFLIIFNSFALGGEKATKRQQDWKIWVSNTTQGNKG